jgi:hypothetical protein
MPLIMEALNLDYPPQVERPSAKQCHVSGFNPQTSGKYWALRRVQWKMLMIFHERGHCGLYGPLSVSVSVGRTVKSRKLLQTGHVFRVISRENNPKHFEARKSSKCYLGVQSIPQTEHNASTLERSIC